MSEFGWLDLGSDLLHRTKIRENDHESWWGSNDYALLPGGIGEGAAVEAPTDEPSQRQAGGAFTGRQGRRQ